MDGNGKPPVTCARLLPDAGGRGGHPPLPTPSELQDHGPGLWEYLAVLGQASGHVVGRCPRCGERSMMAYSPPSTPWPCCRVCLPEPAPHLEAWSDPALVVHKRPGQPRTKTQLKADGCVVVTGWREMPLG